MEMLSMQGTSFYYQLAEIKELEWKETNATLALYFQGSVGFSPVSFEYFYSLNLPPVSQREIKHMLPTFMYVLLKCYLT